MEPVLFPPTPLDNGLIHNPDGTTIVGPDGFKYIFSNREDYVAFFSRSTRQSIHVVGPAELEMISDDEVSAIWGLPYQSGSLGAVGGDTELGGGHYYEIWRNVNGEWVIVSLKLVIGFSKAIERGPHILMGDREYRAYV